MELQLAEHESLDRLAGGWRIVQLRRGHRYNTDDVITAWTAAAVRPTAASLLDLGAGVGSIGLMALRMMGPESRLVSVEVQEVSAALLRKTLVVNGIHDRVDVRRGDLRDPDVLEPAERFDLITANPPYLPPETATPSPHPQRRAARLELHGDVFDYCRAAARHLAPGGRFVLCFAAADPRPEGAIREAGLVELHRRDVIFRAGRAPMLRIRVCLRADEAANAPPAASKPGPDPLTVRAADGSWTPDWRAVRRAVGIEA